MTPLQNIVFPDSEVFKEPALSVQTTGKVIADTGAGGLKFRAGGGADFGTYFNLFNVGKWHRCCALDDLFLALSGVGEFVLTVQKTCPDMSRQTMIREAFVFDDSEEKIVDLSLCLAEAEAGVISFRLEARSAGSLSKGCFRSGKVPETWPSVAICITTFNRQAVVRNTVARLEHFLETHEHRDRIRVFVVDNGGEAKLKPSETLSVFRNPNLGGAGGFARGLIQARRAGFSHCLFMDDDAEFHLENINRTYAFLALARAPRTAIAGAMISNARQSEMWENGARFFGTCKPVSGGTDLTDFDDVLKMEFASDAEKPSNYYGGWWFFAFPISQVRHFPYPFFVRGDDISFSLSNDFAIETLSGVVSLQDDFGEKESATTLYLDLRNHLVQHLTIDDLRIGPIACAWVAFWFILRNISRFHYETCDALILAWRDVMRGPGFFSENVDMVARLGLLRDMSRGESHRPVATLSFRVRTTLPDFVTQNYFMRQIWKITLNGHLAPFFGRWGNHTLVDRSKAGRLPGLWGSSRVTFLNRTGDMGYSVVISLPRFFDILARSLVTGFRFVLIYGRLRRAYREQYDEMTSADFWSAKLKLPPE